MKKNRLEAFFDGVVAIIITIMVLEMKVPATLYGALLWLVPDRRIERVVAREEA